ncbi:MAG: sulfate adenylyltransferase subunit CysN [Acidobacteria bacterium]|nr:sulfate adenylyltransferase subunit CysN [Acidobacteriota bacterium]
MELLRFSTAGSVDDGKSTLIGRLLYETNGVFEDQLASVKKSGLNRSTGPIDFSLLTDGLRAEREQGITIDVAYRYFSTSRRKFIIADTPGHEQYTRNMATGASTAGLTIILIDARKGVLVQSRRHAFIASLLGIPQIAVAVNKMDLVDFSQTVFEDIRKDFTAFAAGIGLRNLAFFPVSALDGDNIVTVSPRTPWYTGQSLLEHLETVPVAEDRNFEELRFPVQHVIRPTLDFRGFSGQLASGVLKPGDEVMALPSGRVSRVKEIPSFDGPIAEAFTPMSINVVLEDEIDISRGDMLVDPNHVPHVSRRFAAKLVWMHHDVGVAGKTYLLKHTTQTVPAEIRRIRHRVDVNTLEAVEVTELGLNDIAAVVMEARRPLYFDAYAKNRAMGAFILIDPISNLTVGAGMIEESTPELVEPLNLRNLQFTGEDETADHGRLTNAERFARAGHYPATIWLTARRDLAYLVERKLFDLGCQVHVLADDSDSHLLPELARVLNNAGLIAICSIASPHAGERDRAESFTAANRFVEIAAKELPSKDEDAAERILKALEDRGVLRRKDRFTLGEGI